MPNMDIRQIRKRNLRLLIDQRYGGIQANLARAMDCHSNVISRYLGGGRGMGHTFARRVEGIANLPIGWLDHNHEGDVSHKLLTGSQSDSGGLCIVYVPVIEWEEVPKWPHLQSNTIREIRPMVGKPTDTFYALRVRGDAMMNPHGLPSYEAGMYLFIDPHGEVAPGRIVIATVNGEDPIVRQLTAEGKRRYLKPLNPSYPILPVDDKVKFHGTVIMSQRPE